MKPLPCWGRLISAVRSLPRETLEIIAIKGLFVAGHHISILLTKTFTPRGPIPVPGVGRVAKKGVAAIHEARAKRPGGKHLSVPAAAPGMVAPAFWSERF
jgi:hypothetical protein